MGRTQIPISILIYRNELLFAEFLKHRHSIKELGQIFGLGTTQTFDIIKNLKQEHDKQTKIVGHSKKAR